MSDDPIEVILADASESPIERSKKKKTRNRKNRPKHYYSGKKKRHTIKTQVVVNKTNSKYLH
jgi:hypothetical protein